MIDRLISFLWLDGFILGMILGILYDKIGKKEIRKRRLEEDKEIVEQVNWVCSKCGK